MIPVDLQDLKWMQLAKRNIRLNHQKDILIRTLVKFQQCPNKIHSDVDCPVDGEPDRDDCHACWDNWIDNVISESMAERDYFDWARAMATQEGTG